LIDRRGCPTKKAPIKLLLIPEKTPGTLHFMILQRQIIAMLESKKSVGRQFRWPEQPDEMPRTGREAAVMRELRILAANNPAAEGHRHAFIIRPCP
jgi:hypothetical protein